MKKTLTALTAAAAIAAGTMTFSNSANAYAWWVIPAIVAGTVGGVAIGSAAAENSTYQGGPRGNVYVRPSGYSASGYDCRIVDEPMPSGRLRRVRVCD